nr:MAG TPA: hypothetical protein [Caudoviricetes sp.]
MTTFPPCLSSDWQVFYVNCFESLKLLPLQHKDETSLCAKATKVEKRVRDIHMVKS